MGPLASRQPRMRIVLLAALGATLALTGCTGTGTPANQSASGAPPADQASSGTSVDTAAPPPRTDYTGLLSSGRDGKDGALRDFALTFGSIPGVEAPAGADFPGGTQTAVIRRVTRYWNDFSDEQRDAIRSRVLPAPLETTPIDLSSLDATPPGTDPLRPPPPGTRPSGGLTASAGFAGSPNANVLGAREVARRATDAQIEAQIVRATADVRNHLGATTVPEIRLNRIESPDVDDDGSWAIAQPYLDLIGGASIPSSSALTVNDKPCVIHVGNHAAEALGDATYSVIAHEVFHCFQYRSFSGTGDEFNSRPEWVVEGSAAWVGEELARGAVYPLATSWWDAYLHGAPDGSYPMFNNNPYLAIGYFEFLDTSGAPVWDALLPALTYTDDKGAMGFLTGSIDRLDLWTSSTYRTGWEPSSAWSLTTTNQHPTDARRTLAGGTIPHGDVEASSPPGAQHAYRFGVSGDVEFVTIEQQGPSITTWIDDGPSLRFSDGGRGVYCLLDDCLCPDETEPFGGNYQEVARGNDLAVAVSGTSEATSRVKMSGLTKEDVCQPCDGEGGGASLQGGARLQPIESGECEDPCLAGTWHADNADMARQMEERMGASGHATDASVTGTFAIAFQPPGVTVTWGHVVQTTTPLEGGSNLVLTTTGTFTGSTTSPRYHAVAGTITYAPADASALHVETVSAINGRSTPSSGTDFGGMGNMFEGASRYNCTGNDLTLTGTGTPFTILFHRA